jgi:glutamyl/glutaminyl-tRNA synthetase
MLKTRFAPSPTGHLHLGHVVNAIYVWGIAAARQAEVILRIEDHDRIRCRPEYERSILDDLGWLGFTPPEPPLTRQSERDAIYRAALDRLRQTFGVYACDCSRQALRRRQRGGLRDDERYDGYCRTRGLAEMPGRGLRVEMPSEEASGDLLIRDRDGHWTYQFAVTVDDMEQRITLVIRGTDLLSSTSRQLQLARMLGRPDVPEFIHHALITKPGGEKLSKGAGDTGIRSLRDRGVTAAEVIGRAAAAVGLSAQPRPVPAAAVNQFFTDWVTGPTTV